MLLYQRLNDYKYFYIEDETNVNYKILTEVLFTDFNIIHKGNIWKQSENES